MSMGCCRPLAGCMYLLTTAAVTNRPNARPPNASDSRSTVPKTSRSLSVAIVLAALATLSIATAPAEAAEVVCKTNGVAQGCVAAAAPVVVAPAAPVAAATCVAYAAAAPAAVRHVGYTRMTPYDVRHVGYTRAWR